MKQLAYLAVAIAFVTTLSACSNPAGSSPLSIMSPAPSATISVSSPSAPPSSIQTAANGNGFDALGYNRNAHIFNGPADGTDGVLDGKIWGDPSSALDKLEMKWNAAWDACNANRSPANCAGAALNNNWNGQVQGGSGEVWHYKIVWIGGSGLDGEVLPDGGQRIWGEYELVMSQGSVANQHFWEVHANPTGYGAHR